MAEKLRQMQKLSITQLKPVMIFLNNIFLFSHELTVWISFDPSVFIKVKTDNYDEIIRYILERFSKTA